MWVENMETWEKIKKYIVFFYTRILKQWGKAINIGYL